MSTAIISALPKPTKKRKNAKNIQPGISQFWSGVKYMMPVAVAGRDRDRAVANGAELRTARRAVSGKALPRGQSRRRRTRRAGAGGRGLPADPTIPRSHRGANPPRGALGKRCGEERRRVTPAPPSPPDQPRQRADLGQGVSGAGDQRGLCARPRIGEPDGRLVGAVLRLLWSLDRAPYALRSGADARHGGAIPARSD